MTPPKDQAKIDRAVRFCVEACKSASDPHFKISEFVDGLIAASDWTTDEIVEVRKGAIRALRDGARESGRRG
jgi:ABC-type arginine transport system permease subunit